MKDSGVDFCKKIPCHWKILQNRYLFSLRDERNYEPLYEVSLLSLYAELGVFPHGEQEERGNKAVKAEGYKVVHEDDIIVNIILAWMGAIGRSSYNGVTSPAYDIYAPKKDVCSRFFHYLFRTKAFSAECYKYGRGIMAMRWRTYSSEFKSIKVPVPPYEEQCKIADYLDDKCLIIDEIIEKQQAIIEKLKEYKLSVITEAVTKGLQSDIPLIDSQNAILGKIPQTWKSAQIKYIHNGLKDGAHGTYDRLDSGKLLLSSKNVRDDYLEIGDNESYISEEDYKEIVSCGFPQKNDVLLCCIGASIGRCILYNRDEPEAFQRSVIMIRCGRKILPKFLLYSLKSKSTLTQEKLLINQSAQAGLYLGLVSRIYIGLPPLEEQKEIISYLESVTKKVNYDIDIRKKIIDKLTEYKKSLIYEVVTGRRRLKHERF